MQSLANKTWKPVPGCQVADEQKGGDPIVIMISQDAQEKNFEA
jgi:hypothetical protein